MTTYQDPPLQSRRAARANERAENHQTYPDASAATPESLLYATQLDSTGDLTAVRGRRVAETPEDAAPRSEAGYRVRDFSPEARRTALQNWSQAAPVEGNLTYQTQQRPPAPAPEEPAQWAAPAQPIAEPVQPAPPAQPAAAQPGVELPEHTLTRRELRAIREAQGLPPETGPAQAVPASPTSTVPPMPQQYAQPVAPEQPVAAEIPQLVEPAPWPAPVDQTTPPETFTTASHYADPVSPAPAVADGFSAFEALFGVSEPQPSGPVQPQFPTQYAAPMATLQPEYGGPQPVAPAQPQHPTAQPQYEAPSAQPEYAPVPSAQPQYEQPQYAQPEPVQPEYAQPESSTSQPEYAPVASAEPVARAERPVGHWSRQAELDDEEQPTTGSLSREVGIGVVTTNALVLPEIPHHDFTRTLTSTGDILVTGSIDLPRSLSSTGAMPTQLDESDIDHLLDPGDRQVASTDSQPVRAVKAVSTHTSSRGIINATPPKRGNKGLTALIVAACGMLVVVVALAVVIVSTNLLG